MPVTTSCRLCGATIIYAKLADGSVVVLDGNEVYVGEGRYLITDWVRLIAEPVLKAEPAVGAHPLHSTLCSRAS